MPSLRAEFPTLRLVVGGDGDAREDLESLVGRLGLSEQITFHGFLTEPAKARLLARAVVFVTPSMQEGWGLTVIEANVFGMPRGCF